MAGGRPSVYKPIYSKKIVKLMSEGHTFASACFEMGVPSTTAYCWVNKKHASYNDEFSCAVKEGRDGYENWLINQMRDGMRNNTREETFNTGLAIWLSKAVCKWEEPARMQNIKLQDVSRIDDKELAEASKQAIEVLESGDK